jgi:hypothetical protein
VVNPSEENESWDLNGIGWVWYDSKPIKILVLPMFYHPFTQKWLKNSLDVHPPHMSSYVFFV